MSQMLTFVADALSAPRPIPWPSGHIIRSSTPLDAVALGRLYYEAYDPGLACESVEEAIADIRATFQGAYGVLWLAASSVIEHDRELVAAMLVVHRAPWEDTPDCPFVIELFTARSCRRQGLARALLSRCLMLVGATERPHLALRVDATNKAAIQLYESLGFRQWRGCPDA
jgi:GNAT superfamily N-acetyltransferase